MSEVTRFESARPYGPAGHHGAVNRLLVGLAKGGVSEVSVWHGRLQPGGGADPHAHQDSLQIYVGMSGAFAVSTDDGVGTTLGPGDAIVIPAGGGHDIENRGEVDATLLVISSPALR
jgi:mannose-6-phosphate isomerase-like protein (cupin superfamily)